MTCKSVHRFKQASGRINVSATLTHRDSAGLNVELKVGDVNDFNLPRFRRHECRQESGQINVSDTLTHRDSADLNVDKKVDK